ncbi:MAG: nucleotidyltransferase family protein [Candidatus Odinarchaeota archaeon]|nr:nucleotidyltransferase family protein [Candidatus Odinarchaeota archaeon]
MVVGVVLCGGEGKRLRPLTYYFQKVMIPVGGKQKPLLEYVVRLLGYHGIKDVVLLVNYKAEQIKNYFDDGKRFGVSIKYVMDDPSLRGTGGAILNAFRQGAIGADDTFVVYYGDILSNIDLSDMLRFHREKGSVATLGLAKRFTVRVGVADLDDDGRVKGFVEKPELEKPVNIGILVLEGSVFNLLNELSQERNDIDLSGDVIPALIKRGQPVYGYVTDSFWYDVGSTERYEKLDNGLVDEKLGFLLK